MKAARLENAAYHDARARLADASGQPELIEAAMAEAAQGGRRFSIVTVWPPSMKFLYDERTRMTSAGTHCVAVRHVSPEDELTRLTSSDGVQQRMGRREAAIIDRVVAECLARLRHRRSRRRRSG